MEVFRLANSDYSKLFIHVDAEMYAESNGDVACFTARHVVLKWLTRGSKTTCMIFVGSRITNFSNQ